MANRDTAPAYVDANLDAKLSAPMTEDEAKRMAAESVLKGDPHGTSDRETSVELAIEITRGRVSDASTVVREADTIYNYLVSGTVPPVDEKKPNSFTNNKPRS